MQVRVTAKTERGRVPTAVTADGGHAEGSALALPDEDVDAHRRFDALVAPHIPALHARAIQLCRSHFDPDDIVQDSLLRAFLAGSQLRDPTRLRAWLLTITTNTFIDRARKKRRSPDPMQLVVEMPAPDPIEPRPWDDIDADDLRRAIDELPDDVRDTYRMFALEGREISLTQHASRVTGFGIPTPPSSSALA